MQTFSHLLINFANIQVSFDVELLYDTKLGALWLHGKEQAPVPLRMNICFYLFIFWDLDRNLSYRNVSINVINKLNVKVTTFSSNNNLRL